MGFVIADFQRAIGEKAVQPFLFGHIQLDFSYIGSACKTRLCPGTVLFPADCNQISEEVGEVTSVGNERFFRGHLQVKMFLDERSHIGFDLLCVLFASNHTNQEIISVADINNPSVFRIHGVAVRDRAQSAIKFLYLRHDLPAFFLTDFCFIAFQPFLFSAPDIQRLFVGRVDFPLCTTVKGFCILRHEHIQFIEVDIRQNWAN